MSTVDYTGVTNVSYVFEVGKVHVCHNVSIIDDTICEPDENFSYLLEYISGQLPINLDQPATNIIIDDTAEPECGKLKSYMNYTCYINLLSQIQCGYRRNHEPR